MNIDLILNILAFAVLVFIAAELYVIARELSRGVTLMIKDKEGREGQAGGQTINVNLSPAGTGGQTVTTGNAAQVPAGAGPALEMNPMGSPASGSGDDTVYPSLEPVATKAVKTGQFSVKCPRCQAENSSYRGECFNCGERL